MAKLRPLWAPGKPTSARNPSAPSMVSPVPANAVTFFDDFYSSIITNVGFGSGTIATPDTLTNIAPLGGPTWTATEFAGTAGTTNITAGANAFTGTGTVSLTTGNGSGDSIGIDLGGVTAGGVPAFYLSQTLPSNGLWRVQVPSGLTTQDFGVGWVTTGITCATDWLTDPDTTLLAGLAVVFTKHVASYSGDAAGDLVCRIYDAGSVFDTSFVVLAAASLAVATAYKLEIGCDGTSLLVYLNGAQVGAAVTLTGLAGTNSLRPTARVKNTTAAVRVFSLDCYYQELGQATAR